MSGHVPLQSEGPERPFGRGDPRLASSFVSLHFKGSLRITWPPCPEAKCARRALFSTNVDRRKGLPDDKEDWPLEWRSRSCIVPPASRGAVYGRLGCPVLT